jgi:hypothetical protein
VEIGRPALGAARVRGASSGTPSPSSHNGLNPT